MKLSYLHSEIPELHTDFLHEGDVRVGDSNGYDNSWAMRICLESIKLAKRLGILSIDYASHGDIHNVSESQSLAFKAPLTTAVVNKKIIYLKGWNYFASCIKGFNTIGLMADHHAKELERIQKLSTIALRSLKLDFLYSREDAQGKKIFEDKDFKKVRPDELIDIETYDLAIWSAFANRTIFCSTSSNMGITSHQALRLMQGLKIQWRGEIFPLLNPTEGKLVIWVPDERADFMDEEKTQLLRDLQNEKPQITKLKTYINRQKRDPGALTDALLAGGYFFPTNPQSEEEMQNLVFISLKKIENQRKVPFSQLLKDQNIRKALEGINASVVDSKVIVERGIESGIYGLMIPYMIMLEEFLKTNMGTALSTWNQASIGAALAAATLADEILQAPCNLTNSVRSSLNNSFPAIGEFLESNKLGKDIETRIHGVFDLANLQSLAQLLGVVVKNHLSGRGTAYVGLGSSSYSNGNRCFEILRRNMNNGGAFRGKEAFHPSTHAINPYAQALVFGEKLYQFLHQFDEFEILSKTNIENIMLHVKKPEPAGAAAIAGYLLTRMDSGTLSMVELAYALKLLGYSKDSFLEFVGCSGGHKDFNLFLQEAYEEGENMGDFSKNMLLLLDWSEPDLKIKMKIEKEQSIIRYRQAPLDDILCEELDGIIAIYLTGDNCQQPSYQLVEKLAVSCWENRKKIEEFLNHFSKFTRA